MCLPGQTELIERCAVYCTMGCLDEQYNGAYSHCGALIVLTSSAIRIAMLPFCPKGTAFRQDVRKGMFSQSYFPRHERGSLHNFLGGAVP